MTKTVLNIAILLISLSITSVSIAKAATISLEPLSAADLPKGCSCKIESPKEDILLTSEFSDKASVLTRIDGTLRELKWASSTAKKIKAKKGDKFTRVYEDGSTQLKLDYTVTIGCPPTKSLKCEGMTQTVDALLTDGQRKNEIKSLRGECGC